MISFLLLSFIYFQRYLKNLNRICNCCPYPKHIFRINLISLKTFSYTSYVCITFGTIFQFLMKVAFEEDYSQPDFDPVEIVKKKQCKTN